MDPTHYILGGLAGLLPGGAAAYSILNSVLKGKAPAIIKEAEQTGDHIKEKKILKAKEKFLKLKEEHNKEIKTRIAKVKSLEDKPKEPDKAQAQEAKLQSEASGMTVKSDKEELKEQILGDARAMAAQQTQEILDEARTRANQEAKKIATQSSREQRVMVESDQVNEEMADQISFNILQRIMNAMTYPGQVKVTVILETRAVSVAK